MALAVAVDRMIANANVTENKLRKKGITKQSIVQTSKLIAYPGW